MTNVDHFNCLDIQKAVGSTPVDRCLLLEDDARLVLVDEGIGMEELRNGEEHFEPAMIETTGFDFHTDQPMLVQLAAHGRNPKDARNCIASHLDSDHICGLSDFPGIQVHVSSEDWKAFLNGNPRYIVPIFGHTLGNVALQ